MRPLLLLAVFFVLVVAPSAGAWTWPASGPVLQPYDFDPAHPYAAGQHRGIDIAGDAGATVLAPATGTVTFAGTVPSSGKSITIATSAGDAVTLTHLGSLLVAAGAAVAEGDGVGTIGPSGDPEVAQPYVHLGVRIAAEPQGYLDPLSVLPGRAAAPTSPAPAAADPGAGRTADAPGAGAAPPAAAPPSTNVAGCDVARSGVTRRRIACDGVDARARDGAAGRGLGPRRECCRAADREPVGRRGAVVFVLRRASPPAVCRHSGVCDPQSAWPGGTAHACLGARQRGGGLDTRFNTRLEAARGTRFDGTRFDGTQFDGTGTAFATRQLRASARGGRPVVGGRRAAGDEGPR